MTDLHAYAWPITRIDDALTLLSRRYGLRAVAHQPPSLPSATPWDAALTQRWLEIVAEQLGLEVEPTHATYATLPQLLSQAAPALLQVPASLPDEAPRFLVLLHRGRRKLGLLGPDAVLRWAPITAVRALLCERESTPYISGADSPVGAFLASAAIPARRRAKVQQALLAELLGGKPIQGCWLVRLPPGAALRLQLRRLQAPPAIRQLLIGFLAQLGLGVLAWWMVGRSSLAGHFEWGWLWGWALLLLTVIPFQWLTEQAQSRLATDGGGLFKQRLLYGALQLPPEAVRQEGAGHFLGRVLASEAMEQLALGGGFLAVLALLQIGAAVAVLTVGAGGINHAALLGLWLVITLGLGWRYYTHSRAWDESHRVLTNDLVERMVGHRTRLAQEDPAQWHVAEDAALQAYLHDLQRADQAGSWFKALVLRGWLVVGLGWLCFRLFQATPTTAALAVSLGGVLLARQALSSIVLGMQSVVAAVLAWREVAPLMNATPQSAQPAATAVAPSLQPTPILPGQPLLALHDVDFRYRESGRLVLRGCTLQIRQGERLLVEGPSGGGKSTLAALLAGLRTPSAGLLLLRGLDQQTIGPTHWRRQVVVAPQFHENHVLTGTLAFNLLMGSRWPPQPADLHEAETICHELGLGDLLARMPAGLQQMVGESGWQLSHGERSRLYMARALLQRAALIILDESFAALDPASLEQALQTVLARAPTVLIIAHP